MAEVCPVSVVKHVLFVKESVDSVLSDHLKQNERLVLISHGLLCLTKQGKSFHVNMTSATCG